MVGNNRAQLLEDVGSLLSRYYDAFAEDDGAGQVAENKSFLFLARNLMDVLSKSTEPLGNKEEQAVKRSLFRLRQKLDDLLSSEEERLEKLAAQIEMLTIPPILFGSEQNITASYLEKRNAVLNAKVLLQKENVTVSELSDAYATYWLAALDYQNAVDDYAAANPGTTISETYEPAATRAMRLQTEIQGLKLPNMLFFTQATELDSCYQARRKAAEDAKKVLKQYARGEKTLDELELAYEAYCIEDRAYQKAFSSRQEELVSQYNLFRDERAKYIDSDGEVIELMLDHQFFFDKFEDTYEEIFKKLNEASDAFQEELRTPLVSRDDVIQRERQFENIKGQFVSEQHLATQKMREYIQQRIKAFEDGRKAFLNELQGMKTDPITLQRVEDFSLDPQKIKSDLPPNEVVAYVKSVKSNFEQLLSRAPSLEEIWQTKYSDRPKAKKTKEELVIEKLRSYGISSEAVLSLMQNANAASCVNYILRYPDAFALVKAQQTSDIRQPTPDLTSQVLQLLVKDMAILAAPLEHILSHYERCIGESGSERVSFWKLCSEKELLPVLFQLMVPVDDTDKALQNTQQILRELFADEAHGDQYQNIIARLYCSRQSEPFYANSLEAVQANAGFFLKYTLDVLSLDNMRKYPPEQLEALSDMMTAINEAFLFCKRRYVHDPSVTKQLDSVQHSVFDALFLSENLTQGLAESMSVITLSLGCNINLFMQVLMLIERFLLNYCPNLVISEDARELVKMENDIANTESSLKEKLAAFRAGRQDDNEVLEEGPSKSGPQDSPKG